MNQSKKRLILVGWDSADWKIIQPLVDAGQMPALWPAGARTALQGDRGEALCGRRHRAHLFGAAYGKLGVTNRTEAVARFMQHCR